MRSRPAPWPLPLLCLALACTSPDEEAPPSPGSELAELRAALESERRRSAELTAQLAWTQDQLASLANAARASEVPTEPGPPTPPAQAATREDQAGRQERPWFDAPALAERGVPPSEVARLRRLFDAAQLAEIELTHRATREGWRGKSRFGAERTRLAQRVRKEIGDEDYDLLLWATGKPNRVELSDVMSGSPGERAGFQPGDVVVSYAGNRVFRGPELQRATTSGQPGEPVVVDVLRDGVSLSLRIDRGPIGIRLRPARAFPQSR